MKKLFFSLVMMLALITVAGSAMAQTNRTPYLGQTYHYILNGIKVNTISTATISYTGGTTDAALPLAISVLTTTTTISFDVPYGPNATSGKLKVVIQDGTSSCSNSIALDITVAVAPTLALAVTSGGDICQAVGNTSNNTAGSVGQTNTFTYTVTPTISAGAVAAGATYAFKFDLNDYQLGAATVISIVRTSGDGNATPSVAGTAQIVISGATLAQTFTVTFATTTGIAPETIKGTAGTAVLTTGGTGTGTYVGTYSPAFIDVSVKSVPSIGVFE